MRPSRLLTLALAALASCSVDLKVPEASQIECEADGDCPSLHGSLRAR